MFKRTKNRQYVGVKNTGTTCGKAGPCGNHRLPYSGAARPPERSTGVWSVSQILLVWLECNYLANVVTLLT